MNWSEFWSGFRIGFACIITGVEICATAFYRMLFGGADDKRHSKRRNM